MRMQRLDWAAASGFLVYSSSTVVTPICLVHLSRELGFELGRGGAFEAVRSFLIVVVLL